jgi:hypothetical protein
MGFGTGPVADGVFFACLAVLFIAVMEGIAWVLEGFANG